MIEAAGAAARALAGNPADGAAAQRLSAALRRLIAVDEAAGLDLLCRLRPDYAPALVRRAELADLDG